VSVRPGIGVALAAALMLSAPAAASASRMSMYLLNGHVEFHYFADPGESNKLTVTSYAAGNAYCGRPDPYGPQTPSEACYFVKDPGAVGHINVGGSCVSLDPTYPGEAVCFIGKLGFRDDSSAHVYVKLGDGNDTASLGTSAAAALIDAGAGDDAIEAVGAARVEVIGGPGNDTINAHAAADVLEGGDGNDTFSEPCNVIPTPRAHINGGTGIDTVSFACAPGGQTINLRTDPRLVNLESVIGTPDRDVIYGANRNGALQGGAGNDVIHVGSGYHVAEGGDGDDTIYGGAGGQALSGDAGTDTIYGGPGKDYITDTGGDGKYYGAAGNDTIMAGGSLYGGPGNDRLICRGWTFGSADISSSVVTAESCVLSDGPGDDYVEGANPSGAPPYLGDGDFVIAGTGRDTYNLRGGPLAGTGFYCLNEFNTCGEVTLRPDTISYAARRNPVHASLDGRANDGEAGEHDSIVAAGEIIGGSGDDVLVGSSTRPTTLIAGNGNDTLRGGDRGDLLRGGPGTDRLFGGAGDDQLAGGPGVDTFTCGAGKDQVGDLKRGEKANGCEVFGPLPTYPRA
jgi:Ca2+-binding RTX toxin-like protein